MIHGATRRQAANAVTLAPGHQNYATESARIR